MNSDIIINNLTVVIPTFNRLDMLRKILESIPKTIEVIVSDNGSSIPDNFTAEFSAVKFFKTDRLLEALENWNNCISLVNTEWFTIPSDDDLYYENSFQIISKYLKINNKSDLIIFGHNVINEHDQIISSWVPKAELNLAPPFGYSIFKYGVDARFPGMIFRRSLVLSNDCFDTSYKTTAGDSKLIHQCMLNGIVSFIPQVIGAYRVWANNSTTLTLGSAKWLLEIDRWQDEILILAEKKYDQKGESLNLNNIKDEVYARNLIGGLAQTRKNSGFLRAVNFVLNRRYPYHANFKTQLQIIRALFLK